MTAFDIYSAIGGVGEDILEESEDPVRRRINFLPIATVAACIAIFAAGAYFMGNSGNIDTLPEEPGTGRVTDITGSEETITHTVTAVPETGKADEAGEAVETVPASESEGTWSREPYTLTEELITETEPAINTEVSAPNYGEVTTVAPTVTVTMFTSTEQAEQTEQAKPSLLDEQMPPPFEELHESGGDANMLFYSTVNMKLNYLDMSFIDLVGFDTALEWLNETSSSKGELTSVGEVGNLYSFIRHFEIPDETVRELLESMRMSREEDFSDKEIDLLLSGDNVTVAKYFASEYAIVVGENLYSPYWLYNHTAAAYEQAGITPGMVSETAEKYPVFYITADARAAFEEKLSAFTGKEIVLKRPQEIAATAVIIDEPIIE